MARVDGIIRQRPVASFFVFALLFTWLLLPIAATSIPVSLIALCGPAVAAFVVAGIMGSEQRREFGARLTRFDVPVRWYLVALLLPIPITAIRSVIERVIGARGEIEFQPISILSLIVFLLVVGEEAGWRGFALPRLLRRFSPWSASLIVGVLWALWHLPLFYIRSMPQYGSPFLPFIAYTVALSVILTFLIMRTRGSIVIATIFHGAVNTIGLVNTDADPTMRGWTNALAYGLAALTLGLVNWSGHKIREQRSYD